MILENADAFPSCNVHSMKLIQYPAGREGSVRPHRRSRGGSHSSRGFAECLERKSTGNIQMPNFINYRKESI
ncbi:hypothetical protein C1N70_16620 [Cytobacillus firmus]